MPTDAPERPIIDPDQRVSKHPLALGRLEPKWPVWAAIGITIFLHLSVFIVLPEELLISKQSAVAESDDSYEITLVEEPVIEPEYVEVNPEAPENEPDPTNRYSFRNQQAADESPNEDLLNAPNVTGEEDSRKIVQGSVQTTEPTSPVRPATSASLGEGEGTEGGKVGAESLPNEAKPQLAPPPAFLQQEAIEENGTGSSLETKGESLEVTEEPDPDTPINIYKPPQNVPKPELESDDGKGGAPETAENTRPAPRKRPRLNPELVQGPLMNSRGSASRRGALALDATFSEFGEYEQQFYAALQTGWYQEIEFFQPIDTSTRVIIRFTIKADGSIHDIETVFSNASEIATLICETAVSKRSPFRPWTREMVQVMGLEKSVSVSFRYR